MGASSLPPAWQLYLKDHRVSTFKNWPFLEGCACTPERMAEAGFIHCPTENEPDLAQCFFCFKELEGWEPDDDPMQRKPTVSRKNSKRRQRECAVPSSSWPPRSDPAAAGRAAPRVGRAPCRDPAQRLRKQEHPRFEIRIFKLDFCFLLESSAGAASLRAAESRNRFSHFSLVVFVPLVPGLLGVRG
ncbi:baculoviral IAP repeat-containing protein 5 isoform X1 [Mustela nigripes]|uniref:baculoviral IAP repeat-containing protein 5 isoform X1 n=1 Tax=Mustela nigripes TaxID=77151 RepID=UPI0028153D39|nr:baculoviral IAP repeat-containing protein 5 isoform X1 [Mustela nigripes]